MGISNPSSPHMLIMYFSFFQDCKLVFLNATLAAWINASAADNVRQQTCNINGSQRNHNVPSISEGEEVLVFVRVWIWNGLIDASVALVLLLPSSFS